MKKFDDDRLDVVDDPFKRILDVDFKELFGYVLLILFIAGVWIFFTSNAWYSESSVEYLVKKQLGTELCEKCTTNFVFETNIYNLSRVKFTHMGLGMTVSINAGLFSETAISKARLLRQDEY